MLSLLLLIQTSLVTVFCYKVAGNIALEIINHRIKIIRDNYITAL